MLSGIYKITNLVNNKFYIGSAVDLKEREYEHFRRLSKNNHCNILLQNSFNKYKKESFIFEVLKLCNKKDLILKEQYYIDSLNPVFNICKIAGNKLEVKHKEESKEKLRRTLKLKKDTEGSRKLTILQIEEIKEMISNNNKLSNIANKYNVSISTISKLKTTNNIIPNKNITNRLPKRNNVKYSETYLQDIKHKFISSGLSKYKFIQENNLKNYFYKIL